ncbi:MAG: S1C family serine protease [Treponema sp.]|nr:S1C family serine protease [Treponema sp.]
MVRYSFFFFIILILAFPVCVFAQQGAAGVRDYVGLINQSYHPGIVSYFEKAKKEYEKHGENDTAKMIDIILSGSFGSGFLYSDAQGNFYVITNNHVVAQAHTISITFERTDGFKMKIENLKIIATDEEQDLAILAVPSGERLPVTRGLMFLTRQIEEGEDVFSAGFPGLGMTPLWQFARGTVSNAFARFPRSIINDQTMMGPYIQHTAQVDAGNSGGPLLAVQGNAPSGYAVAGVNTLSGINRQAANYAIPVNTVQTFINDALHPKPETFRTALDERLAQFVDGLGGNTAAYPHIAEFLSTACIGENVEYAFEEMVEKANRTVIQTFIQKSRQGLVGAMGISVAWTIENSIRSTGVLRASVKEVSGEGSEYTVAFTINNKDVNSVWIREYGNWRIKSFGTVAAGDRELVNRRQIERKTAENLRVDSDFHIEAGYASLFDKAPAALYAALSFEYFGFNVYFANSDFWNIGIFGGLHIPLRAGKIGFMPYIRLGGAFSYDQEFEDYKEKTWGAVGFPFSLMGQVGLKITTSYVPGLFLGTGFQFNFFSMYDKDYKDYMKMGLSVTAGYAF